MAIATDAFSNDTTTTGTTLTYAHTCTGTNLILWVGVQTPFADTITGVTYNAVAMTRAKTEVNNANDTRVYLYYLIGPATGTNNVVVTSSGSVSMGSQAASYTGVAQSGQPDATGSNTTASDDTTLTTSITTVANNCWLVGYAENNAGTNNTAGANTVMRGTASNRSIMDSGAAKTPAGGFSLIFNWTNANNATSVAASFSPFVAVPFKPRIVVVS